MPPASPAAETLVSPSENATFTIPLIAAVVSLVWYAIVALVCSIGCSQIWRHYSYIRPRAEFTADTAPDVTIIRPLKGLEPRLYDCLAAAFRQDYPKDKIHIRFCVSDRNDPSLPVVQRLLEDFPGYDAKLLLEEDDEALRNGQVGLGPNPKIRNMSRAYREAIGDIIWVVDCNVWVAKGVCGRMIAKLEGHGQKYKNKFVHQLPLVVDIVGSTAGEERALLNGDVGSDAQIRTTSSASATMQHRSDRNVMSIGGGRLEEMFLSSAHAKFYTAINTVAVAPCIIGKSTMFRKSHLNSLTNDLGIDYFSQNICEDHLIGDRLWKKQVPEERQGKKLGKHALCFGDMSVQPMANMSVDEYCRRRVRWLRVRKFTVTLATFVEPGTESFLCSFYGAFAFTTLPFFHQTFGIPQTWTACALFWLLSVSIWCMMDRMLYLKLHSGASIEVDDDTPFFARPARGTSRRAFGEWVLAWIGREALALPIWLWAFYGGTTVEWRGKRFWVGMDMKVHEILDGVEDVQVNGTDTPKRDKARRD